MAQPTTQRLFAHADGMSKQIMERVLPGLEVIIACVEKATVLKREASVMGVKADPLALIACIAEAEGVVGGLRLSVAALSRQVPLLREATKAALLAEPDPDGVAALMPKEILPQ